MSGNEPKSVGGRLLLAVIRLTRMSRQAAPSGLTPSQVSTLAMLARQGQARVTDLATAEGLALPVMTRLVASLEELGLVEKRPSQEDKRSVVLTLTDEGNTRIREIYSARAGVVNQHIGELNAEELAKLEAALPVLEKLASFNLSK